MEGRNLALIVVAIAIFFIGCTSAERATEPAPRPTEVSSDETININTGNKEELQRIPNIGGRLAGEILEYREKHGPFRRREHLMLLNGVSDGRFRKIQHLLRVD